LFHAALLIGLRQEQLRETIGPQTSEHRRKASYLAATYSYRFEEGFREDDPFADVQNNETKEQQALRTRRVVDEIFTYNSDVYAS
jgi:site-specific recombinase XerD